MRAALALALLFALPIAPVPMAVQIHVDSTLVVIPVTVTDAQHRFVLGLEKSDFTLFEDGIEQKVTQFAGEDAPISAGLLVDTSGSMGDKMQLARAAVTQFLKTLNRHDESFLISFGDRARLATPLTSRTSEIEEKLAEVQPEGLTALLDAVPLGLTQMRQARNTRKALLIVSDGGDNNSQYTTAQVKDLVRQADVQVYAMGVFDRFPMLAMSAAEVSGPKLLAQLSEQTGGRVFAASSAADLPAIASRIGIELRNQYVLAYSPANKKHDGKYRKVEVKVKAPPGLTDLQARWRLGYYAPST